MTAPTDITALDAAALLAEHPDAVLLDVREDDEYAAGHAPAARHTPLAQVAPAGLPTGTTIVAVCRAGGRSAKAAATLRGAGHTVLNLTGGMGAWAEAGLPVVVDSGAPGQVI